MNNKVSNKISTIKITQKTKSRISKLKVYDRESYEEVLIKVLEILNILRLNPEKARVILLEREKERRRNKTQEKILPGETTI